MIRGLYFAFIFLFALGAYAQSCSQLLNRAEDAYSAGRLLEIPGLLESCLEDEEFTEAEKIRAHKLLTQVYIFTDNEPDAESELVELLKVDPVHQLQREDPNEMRVLMSKFRTWPIYRLEVRIGGNTNVSEIAQEFSAFSDGSNKKTYAVSTDVSIQAEVDITRHLKKGIEVGGGLQLRLSSYNVGSNPTQIAINGGNEKSLFDTNITNSQTTFRVPIFVRYNHNYDKRTGLLPYVFVGGSFDYLLSAKYTSADRTGGTSFSLQADNANLKKLNQVNDINYSIFGGIGMKFRLPKGNFLFAEGRFDKSLKLYNVPEERYSNPAINGDLLYVEDDLYLNFVSFNVGYIHSVFKPEKLTK